MRVSIEWLKEYVDIPISTKELVEGLTMLGLEVEGTYEYGRGLEQVVVAGIKEVRQHPNADRLKICTAVTGDREFQIVCGAPNLREGMVSALALPGAKLPNGMEIKETKIRGVLSYGMLAAEDELGLTEDHTGIMELPEGLEPGTPLGELPWIKDTVLEISVTPNRSDCNCVLGIAREVGLLCKTSLRLPSYEIEEVEEDIGGWASVDIHDPEGCPRYVAGIIKDITIKPSPFWIRYRIHKAGMRGINNIVDATNYVMLELGQPLHAFDYHKLRGRRIIVKKARDGEVFTTLDGQERTLNKDVLLICDGEGPVAIAGIMGGLNSEISIETNSVLLESAFFDPVTIRKGSKYLGLQTEASYRFERCIDIENVPNALKRALALMRELSGGKVLRGIIDVYPKRYIPASVPLSLKKAREFVGVDISSKEAIDIFQSLGMDVVVESEDRIQVTPPSYRPDIKIPVDLMEELVRVIGYENVPVTYPKISSMKQWDTKERYLLEHLSEIMVGFGFQEVITYNFISPSFLEIFKVPKEVGLPGSELRKVIQIINPLSIEQSVMRTSLLPGLLAMAKNNLFQGQNCLRLFEIGEVFFKKEGQELPEEKRMLAALMSQPYQRDTWYSKERAVDIWDIKGIGEALLSAFKLNQVRYLRSTYPGYDPTLCVEVLCGNNPILRFGRIWREVLKAYDIEDKGEIYVLELDVDLLCNNIPKAIQFVPLPKYPPVFRDLSIVVDKVVEAGRLIEEIKGSGKGLVESVEIFDLYEGEKIGTDKKALGLRIAFRSQERTLDGQEINDLIQNMIKRLEDRFFARLRE